MQLDDHDPVEALFDRLLAALPQLEELIEQSNRLHGGEPVLAEITCRMIATLRGLAPERPFCTTFADITTRWARGRDPAPQHLLTPAFLQARFFLQLAVYCAQVKERPRRGGVCSCETAALLRLYQFRP